MAMTKMTRGAATSAEQTAFDRVVDYMAGYGWAIEARDGDSGVFVSSITGRRVALRLQRDRLVQTGGAPLDRDLLAALGRWTKAR
jgi:hypothetical protein